jgi:hypothetical protein
MGQAGSELNSRHHVPMPSYVRSTTLRSVPAPAVRAFDPARAHTMTPIWGGREDRRFVIVSPEGQGASATTPSNRLYSRRGSAVVSGALPTPSNRARLPYQAAFLKMMIWLQPHEPSARVRRLTRSAPIMCRIPDGWWQCCSQATELITFQDQELTSLQSNKNWGSWIISALLRMQTLSENNLMY